jgi:hypothetical protein
MKRAQSKLTQIVVITAVSSLIGLSAFAAVQTSSTKAELKWHDELCEYQSTYDASKFKQQEINNTLQWMTQIHSVLLNSTSFVFQPDQIKDINVAALDAEYKALKQTLTSRSIVNTPDFLALKKQVLINLDQEYKLSRLVAQSFQQPKALLVKDYGQQCLSIAQQLNAPDREKLFQYWGENVAKNIEEQLKLGNSENYRTTQLARFEQQKNSAQALQYAQIELIRQWNNCAIDYKYTDDSSKNWHDTLRKQVFSSTKELACDEP